MKKILLLLMLLFFCIPTHASYWYQYDENSYIDLDSVKKVDNIGCAWVKTLNDGSIPPIDNKKIGYVMDFSYFDFTSKKWGVKEIYFYGLDGKKISKYSFDNLKWDSIIPDTMTENLYNVIYKYPRLEKVSNEDYWVKVTDDVELNISSLLFTNSECSNMEIKMYSKKRVHKTFMSVNMFKREVALLEVTEYNKKGKIIRHVSVNELKYLPLEEDSVLNTVFDYLYNLASFMEQSKNELLK